MFVVLSLLVVMGDYKEDRFHDHHLQCGGPCMPVARRVIPPSSPLFTSFSLGEFELSIRMVYAPLTRCRALGKHPLGLPKGTFGSRYPRFSYSYAGTVPSAAARKYYSQRTVKGGLLLTEATCINDKGHGQVFLRTTISVTVITTRRLQLSS